MVVLDRKKPASTSKPRLPRCNSYNSFLIKDAYVIIGKKQSVDRAFQFT